MSAHAFNTAPVIGQEDLPLRPRLPKISDATRTRLISWAQRQPGVMSWLLIRSAAYFDEFTRQRDLTQFPCDDAEFTVFDSTAALDLLEWQTGMKGREAVDRLESLDQVAKESRL